MLCNYSLDSGSKSSGRSLVKDDNRLIPYVFDVGVANTAQSLSHLKRSLHIEPNKLSVTFTPRHYIDEIGLTKSNKSTIEEELERELLIKTLGVQQYFEKNSR